MIILSQKQEMNNLHDIVKRLTNEKPVTEIKLTNGRKLYVRNKFILIIDILDNISYSKYIRRKELMQHLDEEYVANEIMGKEVRSKRTYYYLTTKGLKL